jgi:TLC domain
VTGCKLAYYESPLLVIFAGVSAVRSVPGSFMRLNPHFLICETTNIFFNTAWILRAAGWRGNAVVLTFEYLFAFTFIPIRIINLTLVIWVLQTQVYKSSFCLISISYFRVISLKFDFDWIHPSFLRRERC